MKVEENRLETEELNEKYPQLVRRSIYFSKNKMIRDERIPKRIDLGAGKNPVDDGVLTVDYSEHNEPDVVMDLETTPWNLPSNYFKEVYIHHVLEHLQNWKDALKEISRITAPGGTVHIRVPHYSVSIRSPDHSNHFSIRSFNELFDPEDSMCVTENLQIVDKQALWAYRGCPSWKSRLSWILNPVVNGRLRPYFDVYWWPFVGGINEIRVILRKTGGDKGV